MANAKKWSNVAVAMQSALAASVSVTAVTKAATGVATAASHGYANGDYVVINAQGMWQINSRCFRVANVATNTFELEGIDTTAFDTFVSGTAQKVTFGTSITTATSLSSSGGDFDFIDTTTIHGNARTQIPGLPSAATYTFENIWDVSDAGLVAMKAASDAQSKRAFKFTFGSGGQVMVFLGYCGANLLPGGSAQQLVTTGSAITMDGTPCYYAS